MSQERHIRKVLVLHAGALGDCVLTLHVAAAMRASWGGPSVTLVSRSAIARWGQRHGLVSEARTFERPGLRRLYDPDAELPNETMRFFQSFDRVISFLGGPSAPVSRQLSSACGMDVLVIDPRPTEATLKAGTHITRQWAEEFRRKGWPLDPSDLGGFELPESDRRLSHKRLAEKIDARTERIALLHPGSGGLEKCCPLEILEAIRHALVDRGWASAWMIGPDEIERFGAPFRERLERSAGMIYEESAEGAADLVCGADLFIGNDAGMTHLAALAGVRTIAFFGPTDPRVWRPLGERCSVVRFPSQTGEAGRFVEQIHRT